MGIDEFKASGSSVCGASSLTVVSAHVELTNCQVNNNVASNAGGGINVLSGSLTLRVSF